MKISESITKVRKEIQSYVKSHCPIIYLQTYEEDKADQVVNELFKGENEKIREWNLASGWIDLKTKEKMMDETLDLASALLSYNSLDMLKKISAIVLKDAHHFLREPRVIAAIKSIVMLLNNPNNGLKVTLFIVSSRREIPIELENFISLFELPSPDKKEILEILKSVDEKNRGTDQQLDELAESLRGLTYHQIVQLVYRILNRSPILNEKGKDLVLEEKSQIIRKSGILELVPTEGKSNSGNLGGFNSLKTWIDSKKMVLDRLSEAEEFGVDLPKGIILAGMPGCGKSLCAKVIAQDFNLPLLRLDVGKLHGRYVGDSEENMRRALKLAEDISPCVLWIDEMEKAFSGVKPGGNSSDVTTRLFGYFLSWLQDRKSPVFVVATANDLSSLPTELLRKGRFDENFFVDFPTPQECAEILKIHLERRKQGHLGNDKLKEIAGKMKKGYSGADIESAVSLAVEQLFVSGTKKITEAHLNKALMDTKSISDAMPEKIKEYREIFKKWNLSPVA